MEHKYSRKSKNLQMYDSIAILDTFSMFKTLLRVDYIKSSAQLNIIPFLVVFTFTSLSLSLWVVAISFVEIERN